MTKPDPVIEIIDYLIGVSQTNKAVDLMETLSPIKHKAEIYRIAKVLLRRYRNGEMIQRVIKLLSHRTHAKFKREFADGYIDFLIQSQQPNQVINFVEQLDSVEAGRQLKKLVDVWPSFARGTKSDQRLALSIPVPLREKYLMQVLQEISNEDRRPVGKLFRYAQFLSKEFRGKKLSTNEIRNIARARVQKLTESCKEDSKYLLYHINDEVRIYKACGWLKDETLRSEFMTTLTTLKGEYPLVEKEWDYIQHGLQ